MKGRSLVRRLISATLYSVRRYPVELAQNRAAIKNLSIDLANSNERRSCYVDHYTEQAEVAVWEKYRREFASNEPNEAVFRATYVRDRVRELIPAGSTILNFGASYGWLEGELSEYRAIGVDRSEEAMSRNRRLFPKATFIDGDIFECLRTAEIDALCHINTGTYFLPRFISRLYRAARGAGAKYLIAFEPSGKSRQTGRYFDYSTDHRNTVVFRGQMLINNYPQLMAETGYSIIHSAILRPPHPHRDFRSACFISKR